MENIFFSALIWLFDIYAAAAAAANDNDVDDDDDVDKISKLELIIQVESPFSVSQYV